MIRAAEDRDIDPIVHVHRNAFRDSFLTRLGPSFLRLYYRTVLRHPAHHFLVAESSGAVIGFAAGFRAVSDFYRALNRQLPAIVLRVLIRSCRHPSMLGRLLADYRLSSKRARVSASNWCELASLAVHPDFGGAGVGMLLVQEFSKTAFGAGAPVIAVTTDADRNARVNAFYRTAGFHLMATSLIQQRRMNEYWLSAEDARDIQTNVPRRAGRDRGDRHE